MATYMTLDRAHCAALDDQDALAFTRDRFRVPDGLVYLDGNSLGALPSATPARLGRLVDHEWGRDLIGSWNSAQWMDLPARIGARIAALIGAHADEVVAADSTSVVLFKLAAAALKLRPGRRVILSETGNFPTDLYVLQGLTEMLGLELRTVASEDVAASLNEEVALLVLTHVHYKTGRVHDMAQLTAQAQGLGVLTLWDLSHSAGALPVDLNGANADFAIGCGYKYFNGGPGAPGYMMAARRHHSAAIQPLYGWIGHAAPFAFDDQYKPASGVKQLLTGTPSVIGLTALEEGLKTFEGVEIVDLRRKSMALGDLFIALVDARLPGVFEVACPRNSAERGSQVSLRHPESYAIVQALIASRVVGDFRAPDVARFGLTPLYLTYSDVFEAVDRLTTIMSTESWRDPIYAERRAVT